MTLVDGWWDDFRDNLDGTIADQEQVEAEYEPAASDINQEMCDLE